MGIFFFFCRENDFVKPESPSENEDHIVFHEYNYINVLKVRLCVKITWFLGYGDVSRCFVGGSFPSLHLKR